MVCRKPQVVLEEQLGELDHAAEVTTEHRVVDSGLGAVPENVPSPCVSVLLLDGGLELLEPILERVRGAKVVGVELAEDHCVDILLLLGAPLSPARCKR